MKLDANFAKEFIGKLKLLKKIHLKGLLHCKKLCNEGLQIISKLNIEAFENLLEGKDTKESDLRWLRYGFPLWLKLYFKDVISIEQLSTKVQNYINSPEEVFAILDKFIEEGEKGQIIAYTGIIKYCLSVHCVPKSMCIFQ